MTGYVWLSLVIAGAAAVVLAAVVASGLGPVASLRRSVSRMREVSEELESVRRAADVAAQRARALRTDPGHHDRP